jgi:Na+/proline symporter/signal transduction histidine kinase
MFDPVIIVIAIFIYIASLFVFGIVAEKNHSLQKKILNTPFAYALSLTVYLTSWTFYGSIGFAADYGLLFLTFHIGATFSILLWWILLRKLVRIKNEYRITSIADFISARYDKSASIAALVTIVAFVGTMPYIALQLRAIIESFAIITYSPAAASIDALNPHQVGPVIVLVMIVFTIIIGVRRLDPTERHPGIIATIALDGIIKIVSFLIVGIFICYVLFDGIGDIFTRFSRTSHPDISNIIGTGTGSFGIWVTRLFLAMAAILFLPRQFHVAVIENSNEKHIRTAMWFLPLYMLVITFFTYPIAIAGLLKGFLPQEADFFILKLPLDSGHPLISLIGFIGGFSAASGMVIITSMTMATMITNHLLLPFVDMIKGFSFIRKNLLQCRWLVVAIFLFTGYWFERNIDQSYLLVQIGTISFAAVFQFAPLIIGGLFWKKANKCGALFGLCAGFAIWFYTLLLPLFIKSGWIDRAILSYGPFGIAWLRPEQLFGFSFPDQLTHSVFWSITLNIFLFVLASLWAEQKPDEQKIATHFIDILKNSGSFQPTSTQHLNVDLLQKKEKILKLLNRYLPPSATVHILDECLETQKIKERENISILELAHLFNDVEKNLAGSIGAASAHHAMKRANLFTRNESKELSKVYADILAELNITPEDMRQKINYYQERESILINQAATLEGLVKKRTEQLERLHAELLSKEKLATLGRLTATVSHELRNPLGTIRSSLYSLAKRIGHEKDEKILEIIDRAERNIERCDLIIDELLEYTRTKELSIELLDIINFMHEILAEIAIPDFITVIKDFSGVISIPADKERLRRSFINLINNAIHSLQIKSSEKIDPVREHYEITISIRKIGDRIEIKIIDTGTGIPADKISKIFEPLYSTKSFGVGLGLSIVKQIIERHGGSIDVQSENRRSTAVTVWLPLHRAEHS